MLAPITLVAQSTGADTFQGDDTYVVAGIGKSHLVVAASGGVGRQLLERPTAGISTRFPRRVSCVYCHQDNNTDVLYRKRWPEARPEQKVITTSGEFPNSLNLQLAMHLASQPGVGLTPMPANSYRVSYPQSCRGVGLSDEVQFAAILTRRSCVARP